MKAPLLPALTIAAVMLAGGSNISRAECILGGRCGGTIFQEGAPAIMWWSRDEAHFDWPAIEICAARDIPMVPASDSDIASTLWQIEYTRISTCRLALAARHEGWIAALGHPAGTPDPFPPQPMDRKGDMQ